MKCIDKCISLTLIACLCLALCGCKDTTVKTYDLEQSTNQYHIAKTTADTGVLLFAEKSCVSEQNNFGLEEVDSQVAKGGGVFNLETGECTYAQNLFGRMYPASTTKILTCLVAIEEGDLDKQVSVSSHAATQSSDSSVANLSTGDKMTLEDLLYGLMLRSGNDAAIAIAESISGSEEAFAELLNKRAASVGATQSHFVTPHGLHDEDHYTTVYDMYLIFQEALKNDIFLEIISTPSYHVSYIGKDGMPKEMTWSNTNRYLNGSEKAPEGFTVIGGKTGTTYEAGYCLVIYSLNDQKQPIISIVYNADCSLNLYYLMNELLYTYGEAP